MSIERLDEGLHRIKVPISDSPLGWLNAYLIRGPERSLLVDTGMNRSECEVALRDSLESLGVDLASTDFFATHGHVDHTGLLSELSTSESNLYASPASIEMIQFETLEEFRAFGRCNGFDESYMDVLMEQHPGTRFGTANRQSLEFEPLEDGDVLTYGEYSLRVIATPGHEQGHLCLYEPDRRYLFAGDHLLRDITPNISSWSREHGNRLGQYLESLDRVAELEVDRVLPGHRSLFDDHRARVRELHEHHESRLREILDLLEEGDANGREIAARMQWDLDTDDWDSFHPVQKWFAVGEAVAHLVLLEHRGEVRRIQKDPDRYARIDHEGD